EHGPPLSTVIAHQPNIPVLHPQQRPTGQFVTAPVLHEAAACKAQMAIWVSETDDALLRNERLCPALKDDGIGNCGSQLKHGDLLGVEAGEMMNASCNRRLASSILHLDVFPIMGRELHRLGHMRCSDAQTRREKPTGAANS